MVDTVQDQDTLIALTSDIVAAHVSHNPMPVDQLPALIERIYQALAGLGGASVADEAPLKPAVPVRASVKPDHVTCLECGKKMSMLKRHLRVDHGLSPDEYRQRWGLASDHPLVAPNYAERRSVLARQTGLGRGKVDRSKEPEPKVKEPEGRQKREKLVLWRKREETVSPSRSASNDHEAAVQATSDPEPSSEKTLIEAIARLRIVTAKYNGSKMSLAPHQLFSRHDELFVSAFNAGKNWRSDEERRLGYFKVSGLSNIALMKDTFVPLPTFDGSLPREGDEQLFAVSA